MGGLSAWSISFKGSFNVKKFGLNEMKHPSNQSEEHIIRKFA